MTDGKENRSPVEAAWAKDGVMRRIEFSRVTSRRDIAKLAGIAMIFAVCFGYVIALIVIFSINREPQKKAEIVSEAGIPNEEFQVDCCVRPDPDCNQYPPCSRSKRSTRKKYNSCFLKLDYETGTCALQHVAPSNDQENMELALKLDEHLKRANVADKLLPLPLQIISGLLVRCDPKNENRCPDDTWGEKVYHNFSNYEEIQKKHNTEECVFITKFGEWILKDCLKFKNKAAMGCGPLEL